MRISYNKVRGGTVPMLDVKERKAIEQIVAKDGLKFAFIVWLTIRIVLSAWGASVMAIAPGETYINVSSHYPSVYVPNHDIYGFALGLWDVSDTQNYITIAQQGYGHDPFFYTAFFPGFPLLIKISTFLLGGQSLLAALLVANIASFFFFWYLYRLVEADYGETIAKRAVIISAVFPTAFFLFMGYTEAPLMALTVAAFYYGRQRQWWLAGIFAGCAALIKQPGIFLIFPLGYMYWMQYMAYKDKLKRASFLKKLEWAWLLLIPITALGYMAYRYFLLSTPTSGATDLGADESITVPGLPLIRAILAIRPDSEFFGANLLDIGFTLAMIVLVAGVVVKLRSRSFAFYSIPIALMSLSVTYGGTMYVRPEIDMPRRILILFPIFILLAVSLPSAKAFRYFCFASLLVGLALTGLFVNWFFVA